MSIGKYLHVECQWHCSVLGCLLAENMKMWMAQDCFPWRLLTLGLMHNVENSIILQTSLAGSIINQKLLFSFFKKKIHLTFSRSEHFLTFHVCVHVFRLHSCTGPLYLWLDDKRALFP